MNNDWYMGSHALVNEVIVYDNSPYVENGAKNAQIAIAKSDGIANKPTFNLYGGNPADSTDKVHDNLIPANILADSSVYTPDASVNPMIAAAEMKSFYTIGAPPTKNIDFDNNIGKWNVDVHNIDEIIDEWTDAQTNDKTEWIP